MTEDLSPNPLRSEVEAMMHQAWTAPGFCVPNQATYPHQWLWDSCFHALIWSAIGSDRGVTEVQSCLAQQGPDGFVPHMTYWSEPEAGAEFWGRPMASSITQPPMYGHAIAELLRAGYDVPAELVERAVLGLLNLGARPRTPAGLVPVFHPWETGCDDSARWDSWLPDGSGSRVERWRSYKGMLVRSMIVGPQGQAVGNEDFAPGSIGFNALVAWNARELLQVTDSADLVRLAEEVTAAVAARWFEDRWVDDGPASGAVRTLDAMTALLVDPRPEAFDALVDGDAYLAPFGPRGAHRDEVSYEPTVYWRGPTWPQLTYLLAVAGARADRGDVAKAMARGLIVGAERSGLAEFWDPETGQGLGAVPQTWTGLALVVADMASSAA